MSRNVISPQKIEKKAMREAKEKARLLKQKEKPKGRFYLPYLIFIISLIYLTDEIASQISALMKTETANDLLKNFGESSVGVLDILTMIAIPFQLLAIFYKPLSDRWGRKKFLVINTFGMGFAMFIIFLSDNIPLYVIGTCIMQFFVPHDMQVVYIMESVPSKHRARIYFTIKSFATLGVMLVPLLRRVMMENMSQWRNVFSVPAVIGIVVSFFALFFARETDAFIDSRLNQLSKTDEQIRTEKENKEASASQGGVIPALKFVLKHKQLLWLFVVAALTNVGFLITMQYQVIISYGYASHYGEVTDAVLNAVSLNEVTDALFFFPIGSAFVQFFVGVFGDWLGRKKTAIIMSVSTVISFFGFTLGSANGLPTWIVGILAGACIGSFWGAGDINALMVSESSPTNLRSSILSTLYFGMGAGIAISYVVGIPLITWLGNSVISTVCMCFTIPGYIGAFIVLLAKTHETKGIDMNTVTGCEWD